jgi:predicted PurR-regulated permease PerM
MDKEQEDSARQTYKKKVNDLRRLGREMSATPVRIIFLFNLITASFIIFLILLWRLRSLIIIVIAGTFVAMILYPPVSYLKSKGLKPIVATSIVFFLAILLLIVALYLLISPAYENVNHLVAHLPTIVNQAEHGKGEAGKLAEKLHIANYIKENDAKLKKAVSNLGKPAIAVGKKVLSGVIGITTVIVLAFFVLYQGPVLFNAGLSFFEQDKAKRTKQIAKHMMQSVTGYMLGRLITALIASTVTLITLLITGVPYPLAFAIWVAIVDFLPLIGGLLAAVPTVIVAALHSLDSGIIVLIVFLIYQQIENHVLNPIIFSKTVKLNPLWVLLSVLFGAEIGSILGGEFAAILLAILAIPLAGSIQILLQELAATDTASSAT